MWSLWLIPAFAGDTWSDPHPGIRLLARTTSEPWVVSALEVDLCADGVAVRATTSDERQQTTTSFRSAVGAQAAINGDFFSYSDYSPTGLAIGEGQLWHDDNDTLGFVAFGTERAEISEPTDVVSDTAWMAQAVGGYPLLVRDGVALTSFSPAPSHCDDRHPRTAVALSVDAATLWMVVVDGRSSASDGMTCRELADLLEGLGAYTALNLDGGGSSTLTVEGLGTVNDPSDGSERTVSNHLAVFADGHTWPEHCAGREGGLAQHAAQLDDPGLTDLDGDGAADVCGRSPEGLVCRTGAGDWTIDELSDANGWDDPLNHGTLRLGDVTGDALVDVCLRGDDGVRCWPSTGAGFGDALTGPDLSDAGSWDAPEFATTFRLADFDGDGLEDACAKGWSAWRCWPATGAGFDGSVDGPAWVQGTGWEQVSWYGTIRTGDIDGDGRDDVCGRDDSGVECWLSDGAGFPTPVTGPAWTDAAGWDAEDRWSTIRLLDLDGDGLADLCGRDADGVVCHRSLGTAFDTALVGPELSDDLGWSDLGNATTLRWGDLDGDGDRDLCARANAGIVCWPFEGDGWGERFDGPALSDDAGWDVPERYGSLRLGDVTGDGRADLCGLEDDGLWCWPSTGLGFGPAEAGPSWTAATGWDDESSWATLRLSGAAGWTGSEGDSGSEIQDTGGPWQRIERPEAGCGCAQGGAGSWTLLGWALLGVLAVRGPARAPRPPPPASSPGPRTAARRRRGRPGSGPGRP